MRIGCRTFLRTIVGEGQLTSLQTDFPTAKERRIDYLAVLVSPDGSRTLIQVEFQTTKDARMAKRMLAYCSDILNWLDERPVDSVGPLPDEVVQIVVYVGPGEWRLEPGIRSRYLDFQFELVNAGELDVRLLLEAGDLGDAVVAVLTTDATDPNVIRAILNRIARAPESERADAVAQLLALSELRGIRPLIEQEYNAMPITVSVENIEMLRRPIDRAFDSGKAEGKAEGHARGKAEAIASILGRRFPGQVPSGLVDRLSLVTAGPLEEILQKSLAANSVADALGSYAPTNGSRPKA